MNVITLINEKGGVGKTTNANTIAAGLAIRGQNVLLIDADPQANTTTMNHAQPIDALYRVLVQDAEWADYTLEVNPAIWAGNYAPAGQLYILPANVNIRLIPEALDDVNRMAERITELAGHIDTVVIDAMPTPSMLHAMIYRASTGILIPAIAEMESLEGMGKTIMRLTKESTARKNEGLPPLNIMGIQFNMVENSNAHTYGIEQTAKQFKSLIWEPIPKRTVWRDAGYARQRIFAFAPGHAAEAEAWSMVDRVAQTCGVMANG